MPDKIHLRARPDIALRRSMGSFPEQWLLIKPKWWGAYWIFMPQMLQVTKDNHFGLKNSAFGENKVSMLCQTKLLFNVFLVYSLIQELYLIGWWGWLIWVSTVFKQVEQKRGCDVEQVSDYRASMTQTKTHVKLLIYKEEKQKRTKYMYI